MTMRRPGLLARRRDGGQDGGHQVGEALAHAGARLDHQVAGPLDGRRHRRGHCELLVAVFVVLQPGGDSPSRSKDVGGRVHAIQRTRGGSNAEGMSRRVALALPVSRVP